MKILQKSTLFLSLLLMAGMNTSCIILKAPEKIEASGITSTRDTSLAGFSQLKISSLFQVELVPSGKDSLHLEFDQALEPYLDIRCEGNRLDLGLKESVRTDDGLQVKARLFYKELESLRVSGGSSARFLDTLRTERLSVRISGASSVHVLADAGNLDVKGSGASQFSGYCQARNARMELSGASLANPQGHIGKGHVRLSGASHFKAYPLAFDTLSIEASGASHGKCTARKMLDAQVSGASSLHYQGEARTSIKTSGASSELKQES